MKTYPALNLFKQEHPTPPDTEEQKNWTWHMLNSDGNLLKTNFRPSHFDACVELKDYPNTERERPYGTDCRVYIEQQMNKQQVKP